MKIKKTLYNWLTNRFLLIIRNEENFAEKRTFSFNYAKLIVFGISFLVLIFTLNIYLINTVFYWFNPEYQELETNKKLVYLHAQVDSLNNEVRKRDLYGNNLYQILSGKPGASSDDTTGRKGNTVNSRNISIDSITPVDVRLRKEIEQQQGAVVNLNKIGTNNENYFVKPAEGVLIQRFESGSGKLGVEILTKNGQVVKSVAEGVVVWSNYSNEGYVIGIQHKNGFISVYKENSDLLKSTGDYVNAGEGIAISGEKSAENRIHFELWKEGSPVNPEHFISF